MNWERVLKETQAIKASSVLSTGESRDFLFRARKLEELENISQMLHKDSKALAERDVEVLKAQKKLVHDLDARPLIQEDKTLTEGLREWKEHIKQQEDLLATTASDMNKVMVEPVKKLINVFPAIQTAIRKRNHLLNEYDKCQQKVDKQKKKERTGPNLVKLDTLQKALNNAKEEFESENTILCKKMSDLYEQRTEYILPSVHALINLQTRQLGETYRACVEIEKHFKSPNPINPNPTDRHTLTDKNRFQEFKALSIV